MRSEHNIQNKILIEISKNKNLTPFRVNVGVAWTGNSMKREGNKLIIESPRPFRTGVPAGFPDLFVLRKRTITDNDVGKDICEFLYCEVKKEDGKLSDNQIKFLDFLKKNKNCNGIVAYSDEDAVDFFKDL